MEPKPERIKGTFTTITVTGASAVANPTGSTGIALTTKEAGTVVFRVDLRTIQILRDCLRECEMLRSRMKGSA